MSKILLPIFYFPPISWFAEFLEETHEVVLEQHEHFPKQTYRNRIEIYGANGKLPLSIPIRHNGKRAMKDIEISDSENWRSLHWKSIKTAYQSSPYFEFYEQQLQAIFEVQETSLMKFNLEILATFLKIFKIEKKFQLSTEYYKTPEGIKDLRDDFSAKKPSLKARQEYYQVFSEKYGFLNDLSVLDLLCNLGPESLSYLKNINK